MYTYKYRKPLPYVALAVLLALSLLAWQHYEKMAMEREERRYNEYVEDVVKEVTERLDKHKMILRGGAGLFPASNEVTREGWRAYYQYQRVSTLYPGIRGVAFSRVVRPPELAQHIEEIRAEGFTDYTVWPEGERGLYVPVVFMEPFDEQNRHLLGYDLFSAAELRAVMEQARDTNEASISGKVSLPWERGEGIQPAFLMFVPVYARGMPFNSPEERRAALEGYVFGAYFMAELMQGIFPDPMHKIDFYIYDGSEVSPEALIYDSRVSLDTPSSERRPLFTSQKTLDIYGHQWTMVFETTPVFEAAVDQYTPKGILAAGLLISFLLFFYLRTLETTGERALSLARKMTSALQESEEKYRFLAENIADVIWSADLEGRLTLISPAVENMLGYTPEELMGMPMPDYIVREDYDAMMARLAEELAKPPAERARTATVQARHITKDNRLVHVELNVSWIKDEQGNPIGLQGSTRDITERKLAEEEARRQSNRVEALLRIASRLNAELELKTVLHTVCEEVCSALHAPLSAFLLYDSNDRVFRLAADSGLPPEFAKSIEPLSREAYDEFVQRLGKFGVITGLGSVPHLLYAELLREYGIKSFAYAVLERDESLLGILVAGTDTEEVSFPEDAADLLSGLADQAATAVTNALLFEETQQRLRQVQALRNIDLAITGSLDLRVTFQVVLDEVTKMLQTDAAAILRLDPHTGTLKYEHWRGFQTKDIERINIPLGQGYGGRIALERQSIHIPDLRESEPDPIQGPLINGEGFAAYYGVPLIAKGSVLGVLEVFHREPLGSDGDWLTFLETLGGQAAIAIDNAELFSKLERFNVDLLRAYDATIEGWAYALELKDEETEGHSRRVTELTLRIARRMGIKDEELAHVRRGALLHDIGKMGIPDSILLKPGKLTDEEGEIMRKHPLYAFEMLSPIDYLRPALDIPYCHHEKFDGSGYPRGLKGEQIPLAARIFAVVDVYDALTSDRPYRPAWPREKV